MNCVYMISCRDETVPEIYIGATNNFIKRRRDHFYSCNKPNNRCYNFKLYRFIRSNGGIDNFVMEILERCYEDEDKFEIEKNYIEKYNPELNTLKNFNFDKKEWNKKNKDKIKKQKKEYHEKNKEKILEKKREQYLKNKEKYNEKICCRACKCEISKRHFKGHCRNKKHINNTDRDRYRQTIQILKVK